MSTPVVMNAGQKMTVTAGSFVDGAGTPVAGLPSGTKIVFSVVAGPLTIAPNPDNVSAVVTAGEPNTQGQAAQVGANLTFTDSIGVTHNESVFLSISVNFDPGVIVSFALSNTVPA